MSLPLRSFLIVAALMMVLPSCIRSHIGSNIRQVQEVRLGVDANNPIDGRVYEVEGGKRYVPAPEVSYRVDSPIISGAGWPFAQLVGISSVRYPVIDIQPTGRVLIVECEGSVVLRPVAVTQELPAEAKLIYTEQKRGDLTLKDELFGCFSYQQKAGFWRTMAAVPFDFAIDPALSVVGSTVDFTANTFIVLFIWLPHWIITGNPH